MPDRTGWHCTTCNHYFQTPASAPPPDRCEFCGEAGGLERIGHERAAIDVGVGETVACEILGQTREYVVGDVVDIRQDRIVVEAHDGTGQYTIKPNQIVRRRGSN